MPIIDSDFKPHFRFRNAYIQCVLPTLLRKVEPVHYTRQRVHTSDGDFIDLDWSLAKENKVPAESLAVICHGLEGSSDRAYMRGMVKAFNTHGIDAVAYNFRGCSGETNWMKKLYSAGATDDLQEVLDAINRAGNYQSIYLVGFSLGGNLVLKYGGEKGRDIDPHIKGMAAISAPCDLQSSSVELLKSKNFIFSFRFLAMLRKKIREKAELYPEMKSIDIKAIKNLKQFDDQITAPLAGYKDAEDYWYKASCIRELDQIVIPAYIINAADDPILGSECYPYQIARSHPFIHLEVPARGGHVGFMHRPNQNEYWHETKTAEFLMRINNDDK